MAERQVSPQEKTPSVSLVTPTRGRPEAMKLCEQYVNRQDYCGKIDWVVCEGSTQRSNLRAALRLGKCTGDVILFFEDDDWYSPSYVRNMVSLLQHHDLVGEGLALYYRVSDRRYRRNGNTQHASLCQTGMRRELLGLFEKVIANASWGFDVRLWSLANKRGHSTHLVFGKNWCVGIKGMPGVPGIGIGHRAMRGYKRDPDMKKLKSIIGTDTTFYEDFYDA